MTSRRHSIALETSVIARLATPVVLAQIGWMSLGLVDMWMVGHLGPEALAGVALGDLWIYGTLLVAQGVMMGLDPIVSQAHGAGEGARAGSALQRGVVLAVLLSLPVMALWAVTGPVLRLAGQDPVLAEVAQRYTMIQIFSPAPFLVFVAMRQYLQGRGIMLPMLAVVILANVMNAFLNWVFIYGKLGAPAMGAVGSGLSTGITRTVMPLAMAGIIVALALHREAWIPWSRSAFDLGEMREILEYGIPVGAQLGLEVWAFSIAGLFAGWLGPDQLAAHTIVLKLSAFSYMVALGISHASSTRVGNLVGAGDRREAQRAAWVAVGMAAGAMALFAVAFTLFRFELPALFLPAGATATIGFAAAILPIASAFQVFDGTQAVGGGVLRGLGDTRPAAWFNFFGYYVLGLPLAVFLAFRGEAWGLPGLGWGLPGIWIGLALGLGAVAVLLVIYIARRGPAYSVRSGGAGRAT